MDKTLNDKIDGFFRGIVFILFDSIATAWRLMTAPRIGAISLVRRAGQKDTQQTRPYVFLFLSLFSAFVFPTFLGAVRDESDIYAYHYFVDGDDILSRSPVGRVFDAAVQNFDGKALLPLLVSSILGVTIFHLAMQMLARAAVRDDRRRRTLADALFFVAGAQVLLVFAAWVMMDLVSFPFGQFAEWILTLLGAFSAALFRKADAFEPRWLSMMQAAVVTWVLLLPLPIAIHIARRRWRARPNGWRLRASRTLMTLMVLVYVDTSFVLTWVAASLLRDKVAPAGEQPYQIHDVDCVVGKAGAGFTLTASALVTVTGKEAWEFRRDDFRLYLNAHRAPSDPPAQRHTRRQFYDPDRIGTSVDGPIELQADGVNRPVLVEPGRWKMITLTTPIQDRVLRFLASHSKDQRCTVADSNDNAAGRLGPVTFNQR